MRHQIYLYLLGIIMLSLPIFAQASAQSTAIGSDAAQAYSDAKYDDAIRLWTQEAETVETPSSALLYNLGNAYFKQGEYGRALLYFQRAYRLAPSDPDIRHNIRITRAKTVDRMESKPIFFLSVWMDSISHWLGLNGWMAIGLLFFALTITGILLYRLSSGRRLRLAGFYGGLVGFLLFLLSNLMVARSYHFIHDTTEAVVTQSVVTVKTSPDLSSEDMMVVHTGMEVIVMQSLAGWSEVEFPNGAIGWIENKSFELINPTNNP